MPAGSYVKRMPWGQQKPPLGYGIDWSHPLSKGLKVRLLFNDGTGRRVVDVACNNIATLDGSLTYSPSVKGVGMLMNVEGITTTDNIRFSKLPLNPDNAWTIIYDNLWIGANVFDYIVGVSNLYSSQSLSLRNATSLSTPRLWLQKITDATHLKLISTPGQYTINQFNTLAFVFGGTQLYADSHIYNNGKEMAYNEVGNATGNWTQSKGNWAIGGYSTTGANVLLNDFAWYDRALSSDEVAALYAEPYQMIEGWNYVRSYSIPSSAFINSSFWYQNPVLEAI